MENGFDVSVLTITTPSLLPAFNIRCPSKWNQKKCIKISDKINVEMLHQKWLRVVFLPIENYEQYIFQK